MPQFSMRGCSDCICQRCMLWWQSKCPFGGCYDDHRAEELPYDREHPGEIRKGWSSWNEPGEQAHWCRGGVTYTESECIHFVEYIKPTVRYCLNAVVTQWADGFIDCSLVDNIGCEECMRQWEERQEKKEKSSMNEIANTTAGGIALLDNLAREARYYSQSMVDSMIQLGRVFTEAKELVQHGEWEAWIKENTGFSLRRAQTFMQAYHRFGDNPQVAKIEERSKVLKMLSLPEGAEDKFIEEHDVNAMTAREVEEAVRQARREADAALKAEREARIEAERYARELEDRPPIIPEETVDTLRRQEEEIAGLRKEVQRVAEQGREAVSEANRLRAETATLNREISDRDEMISEVQAEYDRLQEDLLSMKSAAARGDAEREPVDRLTLDVFAGAVRQFIGVCARMPSMGTAFAAMAISEYDYYRELVSTIEKWVQGTKEAMGTINVNLEVDDIG